MMDYAEYQRRVLARCSTTYHTDTIDVTDLRLALVDFINAGNRLDRIKKAIFYGKPFSWNGVTFSEVMDGLTLPSPEDQRIIHAGLGLATEGVELVEAIFEFIFHHKQFDGVNLSEEFGDAEWYRALGLDAIQTTHEENLVQNDNKLEKRYGPAFTKDAALNRDLAGERQVLENGNERS